MPSDDLAVTEDPSPVHVSAEPTARAPSREEGGLLRDPVSNDTPSEPDIYTRARATSITSSYAFTNSKKLAFTSSLKTQARDQNARDGRLIHDRVQRSRRLYGLFLEQGPPDATEAGGRRIPNTGEYLQIRQFLQQGVSDQLIESMILKHRGEARHFGLVRCMILKRLASAQQRQAASTPVDQERLRAQREIAAAAMEAAAGSDIAPSASPSSYEGLPNAAAYQPVNPDAVARWRALYADEYE